MPSSALMQLSKALGGIHLNPDLPVEIRPLFAIFPISSTRRNTQKSWLQGRGHLQQGSSLARAAC